MPSRNFCDRCDERIPDGAAWYSVETEVEKPQENVYRSDLFIERQWIAPRHRLSMLCETCIKEILKVILRMSSGD